MRRSATQPNALRGLAEVGQGHGARGRLRRPWPWAVAVPSLLTAGLVAVPLVYIFLRALQRGWTTYAETVFTPLTFELLIRTLLLVAGVLAVAIVIAVPAAWLVVRTDLPGRRLWAVLAALPLVFPSYVAAYSLVAVLGPKGYAAGWLATLGVERLPEIAYGYSGALLALALFSYPYIYLLLVAALQKIDPALEESSRSLGLGRWATFWRVLVPQLRPSLYAGGLLVVLYTLSDFGAVSIARYNTFTLAIYTAYRSLFDRTAAASLATVLVVLTLVFIALEGRLLSGVRQPPARPCRQAVPVRLGRWRWPALAGFVLLTLCTLAVPVGTTFFWGLRGLTAGKELTAVAGAAAGSLSASGLAAVVAVLLATPVAAWALRHPSRGSRLVERLSCAGYALPGLVVALSLVFFLTRFAPILYQSLVALVLAYVVRFLPQAVAAARSALAAVPPRLEEAGRSLGESRFGVLTTLTLPLIRPGLLAGGGLVFLTAMKELPATLILRPIGFETLATRIWTAADDALYSQAALPALLLVAVSAPPVYWLIIRPALRERT